MYGMVNQAIKEMFIEHFNDQKWIDLCESLNISSEDFALFEQNSDTITLDLVLKISEVLECDPSETLISFGKYWINYAFKSEYRDLLDTFSKSPVTLLKSLNSLHQSLELSFTDLNAPAFEMVEENANSAVIDYFSEREMPLEYFVKGLFLGIFDRHNQKCDITFDNESYSHCKARFTITW